jgi:hypothetical protein
MMFFRGFLVFAHVLTAASWLAAAAWVSSDVRRTLALGRPHVDVLPSRVKPAFGLDAAMGIATVVTGAVLMGVSRIGRPGIGLGVGIVLALVRMGVLAVARRAWRDVARRIEAGEVVTADDPSATRVTKLVGMSHGLWVLALAGMVYPI